MEIKITSRELLPDGSTVLRFDREGSFVYPPLPDDGWSERTAKTLCDIQYEERRRTTGTQNELFTPRTYL